MKLNNLYNFKNPVKHFLDIDSIELPIDISSYKIEKLSWTKPFNFRVKKQGDKYRTLKMPNILNFAAAYEHFKDLPNFNRIQEIDYLHKRLSANIDTGDFVTGEYDRQLENDFELLCIYDHLVRLDIKEYYGRIYTHYLGFETPYNELYLTNMNLGATNGLIIGNYLSLYFAELNLKHISNDIENEIQESNLECEFSYFSDDFYFFCNKEYTDNIIKLFDKVLEKYELERNAAKKKTWTYETFNNYNLVARYWKKTMANCNLNIDKDKDDNKLYFINQIIYRMSQLDDEKLKTSFINNFFKTRYFRELDLNKFIIKNYDYHQLCFIFKYSPEALLYSIDKFAEMNMFEKGRVITFFHVRYKQTLQERFNEEQLYFYYAIKTLGFEDILTEAKGVILESDNQILISYYLKDGIFRSEDIAKLKEKDDEMYWFQNYHLILYSDDLRSDLENSIQKYLIPKKAKKTNQKESYLKFYKKNLELGKPIIRDIDNVNIEIKNYLRLRVEESEANFNNEDIES